MGPDSHNDAISSIVELTVDNTAQVFQNLQVTYSYYGHEHSSSSPDEPFSAVTAIYSFLLTDGNSSESITFYTGVDYAGTESIAWGNYIITLLHTSDDQKTVKLKIVKEK